MLLPLLLRDCSPLLLILLQTVSKIFKMWVEDFHNVAPTVVKKFEETAPAPLLLIDTNCIKGLKDVGENLECCFHCC